jgi:hypothetical protein
VTNVTGGPKRTHSSFRAIRIYAPTPYYGALRIDIVNGSVRDPLTGEVRLKSRLALVYAAGRYGYLNNNLDHALTARWWKLTDPAKMARSEMFVDDIHSIVFLVATRHCGTTGSYNQPAPKCRKPISKENKMIATDKKHHDIKIKIAQDLNGPARHALLSRSPQILSQFAQPERRGEDARFAQGFSWTQLKHPLDSLSG